MIMVAAMLPRMLPTMRHPAVVSGIAAGILILGAGVVLLAE